MAGFELQYSVIPTHPAELPLSAALNSQPKWQSCQECELCRAFVIFPQFESLKLPAKSSRTYTSFNYVQLELDTHRLGYNAIHNVNRTKVGNLFKYRNLAKTVVFLLPVLKIWK